MNHIERVHTLFGGNTEADTCRDVLAIPSVAATICAAACDERLPANAMGYIPQLRNAETIAVASDAAAMIRLHIPGFLDGVI